MRIRISILEKLLPGMDGGDVLVLLIQRHHDAGDFPVYAVVYDT